MWNVAYQDGNGFTKLYLGSNVPTYEEALKWAKKFNEKYVGKPYPNGKGFYPFGKAVPVRML
jgi:hypothetical protein